MLNMRFNQQLVGHCARNTLYPLLVQPVHKQWKFLLCGALAGFILIAFTLGKNRSINYDNVQVKYNTRLLTRKNIGPNLVFGVNVCGASQVALLIVIHSAVGNFDNRDAIRKTWGSMKLHKGYRIRHVFVVGRTDDRVITEKLAKERRYRDMIQGDFMDRYGNLTHKLVFWLGRVAQICSRLNYVLKVDDDVFVNPGAAVDYLIGLKEDEKEVPYIGHGRLLRPVPNRWKYSLGYVSKEVWPLSYFPDHIRGWAILTSSKALRIVSRSLEAGEADRRFQTSWRTFANHDVYLGALANVSGIIPRSDPKAFLMSECSGCRVPMQLPQETVAFLPCEYQPQILFNCWANVKKGLSSVE